MVVQQAKTSKLVANLHTDNKCVTAASKPALTSDLFIQGLPFFILWAISCVIFTNHKPKRKIHIVMLSQTINIRVNILI